MNERFEAIVSGRVQMVMYRDFVARFARRIGVTGEVKNLTDGTVRVIAEGPPDALAGLLARVRRGSFLSDVRDIQVSKTAPSGQYDSFEIAYD
ncbi:MAG: acylphosphatase [bacterium]